jgi:hypothetical protein
MYCGFLINCSLRVITNQPFGRRAKKVVIDSVRGGSGVQASNICILGILLGPFWGVQCGCLGFIGWTSRIYEDVRCGGGNGEENNQIKPTTCRDMLESFRSDWRRNTFRVHQTLESSNFRSCFGPSPTEKVTMPEAPEKRASLRIIRTYATELLRLPFGAQQPFFYKMIDAGCRKLYPGQVFDHACIYFYIV